MDLYYILMLLPFVFVIAMARIISNGFWRYNNSEKLSDEVPRKIRAFVWFPRFVNGFWWLRNVTVHEHFEDYCYDGCEWITDKIEK